MRTARNKLETVTVPKFKVQLFSVISSRQHELPSGDLAGSIVFENGPNVATKYDAGRIPLRFKLLNTSETPSESDKHRSLNEKVINDEINVKETSDALLKRFFDLEQHIYFTRVGPESFVTLGETIKDAPATYTAIYFLISLHTLIKFMNKLKYLKEKIRIWTRLHKKSLNIRKSILKAELADLNRVIYKGEGSDADGHRRWEVVRLIQEVEKVDAMEVAQKAKIKWSIEGDENSKYYHGVLNKKRDRLTIRGVLLNGIWMESPHLVKHEFFEHFKNRFKKPNKICILLERDFVKRISLEQNDDLEREVSNEEIKRAVWDCSIDKAPRPDGFTFGFYRWYWDIIGNDVVDAVKWFFCMERSRKEVLANRLFTVLDDIVDEIQSAFVTDRQILDDPFILNEIVH
nr:RNA-directed DNA polymerase, eukaryota [Tanacetum cinerariifolium]